MPDIVRTKNKDETLLKNLSELTGLLEQTAVERDFKGKTAFLERGLLRNSGLLNIIIPKEWGGWGENWLTVFHIVQTISRVDSSLGHLYGFQNLILATIELFGTAEQKEYFFKKTAEENIFWGNALNPLDKRTTVEIKDQCYIFNGIKSFSSGSVDSDMLLISGFMQEKLIIGIVPSDREGLEIKSDWNSFGQRQTDSGGVSFKNVVLYPNEILSQPGPMGDIRATLRSCLAQLSLTHVYNGIAEGAFHEAKKISKASSKAWFKSGVNSPKEDPYIVSKYGNMWIGRQTADVLAQRALNIFQDCWDLGGSITENQRGLCALEIALAKVQSIRSGLAICNEMFEVTGPRATHNSARLDRFWRNLRTHSLHDPLDYKVKELGEWALNDEIPKPGFYS